MDPNQEAVTETVETDSAPRVVGRDEAEVSAPAQAEQTTEPQDNNTISVDRAQYESMREQAASFQRMDQDPEIVEAVMSVLDRRNGSQSPTTAQPEDTTTNTTGGSSEVLAELQSVKQELTRMQQNQRFADLQAKDASLRSDEGSKEFFDFIGKHNLGLESGHELWSQIKNLKSSAQARRVPTEGGSDRGNVSISDAIAKAEQRLRSAKSNLGEATKAAVELARLQREAKQQE